MTPKTRVAALLTLLATLAAAHLPLAYGAGEGEPVCPPYVVEGGKAYAAYVASPAMHVDVEAYALPSLTKVELNVERYTLGETTVVLVEIRPEQNTTAYLILFHQGKETAACIVNTLHQTTIANALNGLLQHYTTEVKKSVGATANTLAAQLAEKIREVNTSIAAKLENHDTRIAKAVQDLNNKLAMQLKELSNKTMLLERKATELEAAAKAIQSLALRKTDITTSIMLALPSTIAALALIVLAIAVTRRT